MKIIDGHDVIEHAEVNGESRDFIKKMTDYIEDAPVVEPKQGEMKRVAIHYECSVCDAWFDDEITFMGELNYCPACGCRWEGADDED